MTKKIKIDGMMCEHCRTRVEKALLEVPGVQVKVDLITKTATVSSDKEIDEKELRRVITNTGYTVVSVE